MMRQRIALAGVLYLLLLMAALIWAFSQGRPAPCAHPEPWLTLDTRSRLSVTLLLALGVAYAVIVGSRALVRRADWARRLHLEFRDVLGPMSRGEIAFFAVSSGVAEEAFFRGAMQPAFGLVLSSLIFGAAHIAPSRAFLPWTAWAAVMGFVFGGMYALTGDILGPALAHVLINYENMHFIRDFDPG